MRIQFYQSALIDIEDSVDYYSEKRLGLGDYFYQDIQNTINVINNHPDIGKPHDIHTHLRLFPLSTFPFTLIYHYEVDDHTIYIVAVAHQRRSPDYWENRI